MFSRYRKEFIGLFLIIFGLFLFLSLVGHSPEDPAFGRTGAAQVKNFTGILGAYISALLFDIFGISSWIIPLFFIFIGFSLILGKKNLSRLSSSGVLFLIAISFSAALMGSNNLFYNRYPTSGGILGTFGKSLVPYLGTPGLILLIAFLQLVGLCLLVGASPTMLFQKSASFLKEITLYVKNLFQKQETMLKASFEANVSENFVYEESRPEESFAPRIKKRSDEDVNVKTLPTSLGDGFQRPPLNLLDDPSPKVSRESKEELLARARLLEEKLADFGIKGRVVEVSPGPVITVYEYEPAPGVKINRITALADDLALGLKAPSVRIVGPLLGKSAIGIEVANKEREIVYIKEILASEAFQKSKSKLTIALGKDISGRPVVTDLTQMPHLLIAGATGTGKSVCLHTMICSLLFKSTPEEVRLLLIDPKRIELSVYDGIPHLLHPVVLEPKMATLALKWAVAEMERRYQLLEEARARNLESYNQQAEEKLAYIVIVVDELADLMVVSSKEVEASLTRLSQMARASGIHLLLATQRPSVDVLTGIIKANFPARISFQVSSRTDSRTILDATGAERLLGAGDMLFLPPGTSKLQRIHGAYISEKEVRRIVEFLKAQGEPEYETNLLVQMEEEKIDDSLDEEVDELYDEAVKLVIKTGQASVSMLQRRLRIGYNRAARMIERMEKEGIVGPSDGVRPRPVLVRPDK